MERVTTKTDLVRGYISALQPEEILPSGIIIAEALGITNRDVWNVLGDLRARGELPHPTKLERSRRISVSKKLAPNRNSYWSGIRVYAEMGMSPLETHFATLFEQGVDIDRLKLNVMLSKKRSEARERMDSGEWQIGEFRDINPDERSDIRRRTAGHLPDNVVDFTTRLWVNARRSISLQRLPIPTDRIEWMDFLDDAKPTMLCVLETASTGTFFDTYVDLLSMNEQARLNMFVADWTERVNFHDIGSRRFNNSNYLAAMLCAQSVGLEDGKYIPSGDQGRMSLQTDGYALPRILFEKIIRYGCLTDSVLHGAEDEARGLSVSDYLRFGTYFTIFAKLHPDMTLKNIVDPDSIRKAIRLNGTLKAIRGWNNWLNSWLDQYKALKAIV